MRMSMGMWKPGEFLSFPLFRRSDNFVIVTSALVEI
jgi:hypothetical protein